MMSWNTMSQHPLAYLAAASHTVEYLASPSVILLDKLAILHRVLVPPPDVDDVYFFLKEVTGYRLLEPWTFVLSRNNASTLIVAVYCNESGRYENKLNVGGSEMLGQDLFGKAVLVCFEEGKGYENGEGAYSYVVGLDTFLRKLAERGQTLPMYKENIAGGRIVDLLHTIKLIVRRGAAEGGEQELISKLQGDTSKEVFRLLSSV
jgi:hypothetical protein